MHSWAGDSPAIDTAQVAESQPGTLERERTVPVAFHGEIARLRMAEVRYRATARSLELVMRILGAHSAFNTLLGCCITWVADLTALVEHALGRVEPGALELAAWISFIDKTGLCTHPDVFAPLVRFEI